MKELNRDQTPAVNDTCAVMGTVVSFTVLGLDEAAAKASLGAACMADALAAVGALDGYAGYLIRPDGSEARTDGIDLSS
jgi:hypothetical protein